MTDLPYDYWKPEEKDPSAPVTDAYDDYWKPEEKELSTPAPDNYDYWKPEETELSTPAPDNYDDYWKPEEKEPYAPVTDNYDSYWQEVDPTPPAPEVDGKAGTDDSDYWDATCMSDSYSCFVLNQYVCGVTVYQTWIAWDETIMRTIIVAMIIYLNKENDLSRDSRCWKKNR